MDDLEELVRYLCSEDSPEHCLLISDLDGFMTGVACCPEHIPVEEWLKVALGEPDQVPAEILSLILKRYGDIKQNLKQQDQRLEPIFWVAKEGHAIAMDWCEGFTLAIKLRPEIWDSLNLSEKVGDLMLPIMVHMFDENGNSLMGLKQEEIDAVLDEAAEAIPIIVPAIYDQLRIIARQ